MTSNKAKSQIKTFPAMSDVLSDVMEEEYPIVSRNDPNRSLFTRPLMGGTRWWHKD